MRSETKIGLLSVAIGLLAGTKMDSSQLLPGMKGTFNEGLALKYSLDNHYRRVPSNKPSRAAHYKRLAKKRQNIRARGSKR